MRHSRVICFLAFALCLLAFVSASADVNSEEAKKEQAKNIIEKVCVQAKWYINTAQNLLQRVEPFKRNVAGVDSHAAQVLSQAETAAKDNVKGKAIVVNINEIAKTVSTLHQSVTGEPVKIVESLQKLLSDAQKLKEECDREIRLIKQSAEKYTNPIAKASAFKTKGDELDKIMNATVKLMDGVDSKAESMVQGLKKAQLAYFHVRVIVTLANVKTVIGDTDGVSLETHNTKNEVDAIVAEVKKHCTTQLIGSNKIIGTQCESANAEIKKATGALEKAQQAETDMKHQKDIADAALTNVQAAKEVNKAHEQMKQAEASVTSIAQIVPKLKSELQTAKNSVTKAKDLKQQILTALSTKNSKPGTEQSLTTSELKPLHDSVSADVKAIQTLMGEAENTLKKTEKHKQELHEIVEEMKKLKTTPKSESNEDIQAQYKTAEDELTKTKSAVDNAKRAIGAITQQKELADTALQNVQEATELSKAQDKVNNAKRCVEKVKESVRQLSSALDAAEIALTNAKNSQQQMLKALSTTTSAPTTEEVKETEKSNLSVQGGTQPDQKDTTTQPITTNTEQPMNKDALGQGNNSTAKLKDKLIKCAQNVPTTALTGEKAPAPGAKNDSAMTVSVPLLLALIASAVLQ